MAGGQGTVSSCSRDAANRSADSPWITRSTASAARRSSVSDCALRGIAPLPQALDQPGGAEVLARVLALLGAYPHVSPIYA